MMKQLLSTVWSGLSRVGRRLAAAVAARAPGVLSDGIGFAGAITVCYGVWLIYPPAAYILGGFMLIAGSMVIGRRLDRKP